MSGNMDMFGDLGAGGVVLSRDELVERRHRAGQCPTCGQKIFEKKYFKKKPITVPGKVLEGRCLVCNPQDPEKEQLEATCAVVVAPPSSSSSAPSAPSRERNHHHRSRGGAGMSNSVIHHGSGSNSNNGHGSSSSHGSSKRLPSIKVGVRKMTNKLSQSALSANSSRSLGGSHLLGNIDESVDEDPPSRARSRKNNTGGGPSSPRSMGGSERDGKGSRKGGRDGKEEGGQRRRKDKGGNAAAGGEGEERRRESLEKGDSGKAYLERYTPRPSLVFLDGINIEDLFNDDDKTLSDDEQGAGIDFDPSPNNGNSSPSNDGRGGMLQRAQRKSIRNSLSPGEREALRSLNTRENSFLDILNIMMMNSMSEKVNNEGLHALSLVHDPDVGLLEQCAESCGFEVIVSAMGQCHKDAMAQTNACKVLFIAGASGAHLQIAIGLAGGIEALVDAMKEFDDDIIVLEGCLLALSNLCIPQENLEYALDTEVIELTVNAMSQNVENCGLQEHGCAVLANLSAHEKAWERIRNCGGCDTVVVSMVVNPMDVGVQCQALVALRNLCAKDEENKVLLANAGAIDVVIQAMLNHRDDVTILSRSSWVLGVIGTNGDNKLYMGENGGPEAVIRSMWAFPDEPTVQEKGCRALWTMSALERNRSTIVEVDAVAAIVAAMHNHAGEPSIQEQGCGVLSNLAANDDDLKIQIVNDGALDVMVMAMVLHGENEFIQERAVALAHKLCIPENFDAMINANVSPMMAVVSENVPHCREKAAVILEKLQ